MTIHRALPLFVSLLASIICPSAALAQQVLVCVTLHNDLANFDRRAEAATHEQQTIDTAKAVNATTEQFTDATCAAARVFATNCDQRSQAAEADRDRTDAMAYDHLNSPLYGRDPVRLRIIAAMRANGCIPLDTYATDYLYDTVPTPANRHRPPALTPPSQIVRAKD